MFKRLIARLVPAAVIATAAGGFIAPSVAAHSVSTIATAACTAVTISAAPTSVVQGSGTHSIATASAATCTSPRYEFWFRTSSSAWSMVQAYGTGATYDWNSTGAPVDTVYIGVRAKDVASTAAYDIANSTTVMVTAAVCTGVTIAAAPTTVVQSTSGGTHSIATASATGCTTTPRYEFWLRAGTGDWTMVRAYGTGATYDWNSTGAAVGTVYIGVRAKDANSTAAYDKVASTTVTVTAAVCTGVTIAAAPTTVVHSTSGGTHSIATASATGCSTTARYEFWLRAGTGDWTMVQAYGTAATYDWNSTGAAIGTVYIGVHVKDANSTAAYDKVASTTVTVT